MENATASRQIRLLIKQINQGFFELLSRELSNYEITVSQWLVIRCLKEEKQKITDISKTVGLTNSTISGIIDRLERSGYVTRIRDREDRRVVWVHRTDKLNQLIASLPLAQDSYYDSFLEGITEEETQRILKSLHLLANQLQKKVCMHQP
ncbi:MarR family transcriptional regulator [Fodinisporobacter ferrooxydans]|uniref:MarR family transcriptional regulator n=1 Tax=Fodinisporobacter ferrooxydans TaxID=2901836 RepID=A0ABY4CP44_9BACL|nr:MarR family transcriptional regulator [Alicyclobacillaceae bacterium MYW30-H2]